MADTLVTFPAGTTHGSSVVQQLIPVTGAEVAQALPLGSPPPAADAQFVAVVVERTPFHPVDAGWPDQPEDVGTCAGLDVVACLVGAQTAAGDVAFGSRIPVRRGDPEWQWWVLHVVDAEGARARGLELGAGVELVVDEQRRAALSRGHSMCHLAALALNAAAADRWTKDPGRRDGLDHPDLDSLAIASSRIGPDSSVDEYRLGKSVRRKGLDTAALAEDLEVVADSTNRTLSGWIAAGGSAAVHTDSDERLVGRRRWTAHLNDVTVEIPCGGTHTTELGLLDGTVVTLERTEQGFRMITARGAGSTGQRSA